MIECFSVVVGVLATLVFVIVVKEMSWKREVGIWSEWGGISFRCMRNELVIFHGVLELVLIQLETIFT